MSKQWKAVLGIALIFILGWLAGALCTSLVLRHKALDFLRRGPYAVAEVIERRMTRTLRLDAGQRHEVHALLMENVRERQKLQAEIRPRIQALDQQTYQQLEALLRPDQEKIFQKRVGEYLLRLKPYRAESSLENPPQSNASAGTPATNSGAETPPAAK